MRITRRTNASGSSFRAVPHVAPISGSGQVDEVHSPDGQDLVNHYFFEALVKRLEELEARERRRRNKNRTVTQSTGLQSVESWLKIPVSEQDDSPQTGKTSHKRAADLYKMMGERD